MQKTIFLQNLWNSPQPLRQLGHVKANMVWWENIWVKKQTDTFVDFEQLPSLTRLVFATSKSVPTLAFEPSI